MKSSIKFAIYLNAVLVYFLLFYSTSLFAETFTETFDVNLGGQLIVNTDAGSIKVETHDKATIELRVKIENREGDEFSYRHELNDGNLTIIGEIEKKHSWVRNLRVEFNLLIPEDYNVELDTSGGSLSIEDLTGNLNANTSGGSIKLSINKQLTKDAKLTTSGGSITAYLIHDIQLDINASTSGGRVKSDFEINGKVKKMSVKGTINGGGPKLTLKTSGGSIKIKEI